MTTTPEDRKPARRIKTSVRRVEAALSNIRLPGEPSELYEPVRYVMEGGGKRVRPVALLLTAEAFGGLEAAKAALPAALAVEVFHNFTLVHDDIMDRAETRRGRPTVHVHWDEATAILAGDLLFGLAHDLLAQAPVEDATSLTRVFYEAVAALCEGQALDLAFERRESVTVADYLDMIDRKTGALLELALHFGGRIGGASAADCDALRRAGVALGRAFQIQDDLLDLTAEADGWGKSIGGDLVEGKRTFLLLRALEAAEGEDRTWLLRAVSGLPEAEVPEARKRMERLGVIAEAREAVSHHTARAEAELSVLPAGEAADALRHLIAALAQRIR